MKIRLAGPQDAAQIRRIYAPYVTDTAVTFEYEVPDVEEFSERIRKTMQKYPYLVAEEAGRILGYAYAGVFRTRAAYQHSVEVSIYVDQTEGGNGVGRKLYQELERRLVLQNVFVSYACITMTERTDDPFLTDGSIRFHEKMGYTLAGRFHHCGYKFGRWYSMIWMEKSICSRPEQPELFLPFSLIPCSIDEYRCI